jgi:hypothetical protein
MRERWALVKVSAIVSDTAPNLGAEGMIARIPLSNSHKRNVMEKALANYLRTDFENWSGGFPPDSLDQIWTYALLAAPSEMAEDEVAEVLKQWLFELGYLKN